MRCSVLNRSEEPVESFRYRVRYFGSKRESPLAEVGFEETHRFSTLNIDGYLQPGEQRVLNFLGSALPAQLDVHLINIDVEVIGVYVPGSRALR